MAAADLKLLETDASLLTQANILAFPLDDLHPDVIPFHLPALSLPPTLCPKLSTHALTVKIYCKTQHMLQAGVPCWFDAYVVPGTTIEELRGR